RIGERPMADVNMQKRPEGQEQQSLSRRGNYDPWRSFFEPFSMGPFGLMRHFRDIDSLVNSAWPGSHAMQSGQWWPAIDISENDGRLVVRADLPGIDKKDIKVEVEDGALTIRGERRREQEENRGGFHRSERSYGTFCRTIELPQGVGSDQAKAQF